MQILCDVSHKTWVKKVKHALNKLLSKVIGMYMQGNNFSQFISTPEGVSVGDKSGLEVKVWDELSNESE